VITSGRIIGIEHEDTKLLRRFSNSAFIASKVTLFTISIGYKTFHSTGGKSRLLNLI